MASFTAKQLRVTFVLSGPSTFSNSQNTLVLTGLRMSSVIQSMQYPAFPQADIEIFGMLAADMNTLTDYENHALAVTRNSIVIEANAGSGWAAVFAGQIVSAQPAYENEPDVALRIKARVMFYESLATTGVTSYTGATDVGTIISALAARIGAAFENDGVQVTLANPYFPGTIADQINAVVEHANISIFYDYGPAGNASGATPPISIVIAPKGQPRSIGSVALSPNNGLVSAPTLDSIGWLYARSIYNPAIKFGGKIAISGSILPRANGNWYALQVMHSLDAVKPDGQWFTDMHLSPYPLYPLPS